MLTTLGDMRRFRRNGLVLLVLLLIGTSRPHPG